MRTVVVPLDGSAFAEMAIETARAIASRTGAALEYVTVHEAEPAPAHVAGGAPARDPRLGNERRKSESDYLARMVAAERGRSVVPVAGVLAEGNVAEEIVARATRTGADLIVMTTHGRGGADRFWLGSIADRVIRRSTVPVLLVRAGPEDAAAGVAFRRVVIAVAGAEEDDRVAEAVLALGGGHRAQLVLVHVMPPPPVTSAIDPPIGPPPDEMAGLPVDRDGLHDAERYLAWLAARLRDGGADVDTQVVRSSSIPRAVRSVAEHVGADLIAVGTAARPPLERLFLGSAADKIVRTAPCSVLVCPARHPDGEARL